MSFFEFVCVGPRIAMIAVIPLKSETLTTRGLIATLFRSVRFVRTVFHTLLISFVSIESIVGHFAGRVRTVRIGIFLSREVHLLVGFWSTFV